MTTDDPKPLLDVLYENERLAAINKPSGLLSVPGRGPDKNDSVQSRVHLEFPGVTGPITVHRLDQDTSGVIIVALNAKTHAALSQQFEKRRVEKRYIAVLDGLLDADEGEVNLPLIIDWPNRPKQMVDHQQGKPASTRYRVLDRDAEAKRTRVAFTPITGRSHQLRVHAAHPASEGGLGCPIAGDPLYGDPSLAPRLLLHAEVLSLVEPITQEKLTFRAPVPF